jgi:outer membrane protein assembly factor BamB
VAYQLNTPHTGATSDAVSTTGPARLWTRNLGGGISYPLIAGGTVYVTVANPNSYGTKLYALNAATGATVWGPIDLGGTYDWSGLAYGSW